MKTRTVILTIIFVFVLALFGAFLYFSSVDSEVPSLLGDVATRLMSPPIIISVSGRVTDATTGQPIKDIPVELLLDCREPIEYGFVPCPAKDPTTVTDGQGNYSLHVSMKLFGNKFDSYSVNINNTTDLVYSMNAGGSVIGGYSSDDDSSVGTVAASNGYYSAMRTFPASTTGVAHFSTQLIPSVVNAADCARMMSRDLQLRCLNILAYQAAERVWTHSDDLPHSSISDYFESYFLQQYERQLFGTCQDMVPGFCRSLEAINRKDAMICDQETGRARQECYFAVAVQLDQPDLCQQAPDRIPEMDERNNYGQHLSKLKCVQYVALKNRDRQACDRLQIKPPVDWQGYTISRGECVRDLAITARDASICLTDPDAQDEDPYKNGTMVEYCASQVGWRTADDHACASLQSSDLKKKCLDGVHQALHPEDSPFAHATF